MIPVSGCQKYCPSSTTAFFFNFQFWAASDSVEISLALWHHWLTTFPNPWTPLCAFITYHPWALQVYWVFSTETMRQFSPLLLFGFCGIIWGWTWPSVPKYRNLFFFWHRLGFKLTVLGWSSMPPGQRTGRTGISSTLAAHRDVLHFSWSCSVICAWTSWKWALQ